MWKTVASIVQSQYGDVNFEEGYFICPECDEPIFNQDWEDSDMLEAGAYVCPVCGAILGLSYDYE